MYIFLQVTPCLEAHSVFIGWLLFSRCIVLHSKAVVAYACVPRARWMDIWGVLQSLLLGLQLADLFMYASEHTGMYELQHDSHTWSCWVLGC